MVTKHKSYLIRQVIYILLSMIGFGWGCSTATPTSIPQDCQTIQSKSQAPIRLPAFLKQVYPPPDSIISMECYQKTPKDYLSQNVYAVIDTSKIVEQGDHLNFEVIKEMTRIDVDARYTKDNLDQSSLFLEDSLIEIFDNEGNTQTSYPGPQALVHLPVTLEPGKHTAVVQVRKTSGAVLEYSWTFTIEP